MSPVQRPAPAEAFGGAGHPGDKPAFNLSTAPSLVPSAAAGGGGSFTVINDLDPQGASMASSRSTNSRL